MKFKPEDHSVIGSNVTFLGTKKIEPFVILGHETKSGETKPLVIGDNCYIRSHSVIYGGTTIGSNFITGHGAVIRENNIIGNNVSVGTYSVIENDSHIEDNVRIHSQAFIPQNTILKHDAWIGPNVVIVNDHYPPLAKNMKGAIIEPFAKIGANVTILDHISIGENAVIGAGAVVVSDVPAHSVFVGNPAKFLKKTEEIQNYVEYLNNSNLK